MVVVEAEVAAVEGDNEAAVEEDNEAAGEEVEVCVEVVEAGEGTNAGSG